MSDQVFLVKQFPDLMAFSQNRPFFDGLVDGVWLLGADLFSNISLKRGEVKIFLTAKIGVLYFKCNKINLEKSKRFVLDESHKIPISYFEIYKKPHSIIKRFY